MLICIKNDKILGRAIVWEVDDNIFMDRVYTCDDYLEDHFLLYAKEHKWWIRESNGLLSDGDAQYWIGPNDEYRNPMTIDMYISLSKIYTFMPYLDSFRYYDSKTHTLSTDPNFGDSRCSDTDGSYQKCKKVKCESCGITMRIWNEDTDYVYYSQLKDAFYCDNCCTWNDDIKDYIPLDIEMIPVVSFNNETIELPLQYVKCRTISETEYHYDGPYFIKIKDIYYYKNLFKWDFNLDKYIINEN
jgi:hypothetical protein